MLQQEHFNDIQRIDTGITGIKNATTTSLAQSTQTTSTKVKDIKSHIEALQHRLESSTKQAVTETMNSALQSFMLKFTNPKQTRSDGIQSNVHCTSPEHK